MKGVKRGLEKRPRKERGKLMKKDTQDKSWPNDICNGKLAISGKSTMTM